jgi:predicted transcriptional regulator of viral defense system
MKFSELLHLLNKETLFESSLLLAGDINPREIRRQLSRWTKTGRINQLRRGLYILAEPYRIHESHPFQVANLLVGSSYVSLQSALSYYNMIPEYTAAVTSVTTRRPGFKNTILGRFEYRHIKKEIFCDYTLVDLPGGQPAFIATPEKSLLDLIYLVPESDTIAYLEELRLHFADHFHLSAFLSLVDKFKSPKLVRAGKNIQKLIALEQMEYESL